MSQGLPRWVSHPSHPPNNNPGFIRPNVGPGPVDRGEMSSVVVFFLVDLEDVMMIVRPSDLVIFLKL